MVGKPDVISLAERANQRGVQATQLRAKELRLAKDADLSVQDAQFKRQGTARGHKLTQLRTERSSLTKSTAGLETRLVQLEAKLRDDQPRNDAETRQQLIKEIVAEQEDVLTCTICMELM